MRYIIHTFVAMIVLCSGLTLQAQEGSLTLRETLDMLNEDIEQTSINHPEDYPDAVRYWIGVLEQQIPASTEADHEKNSAIVKLSYLYQRDKQNDKSLLVLENMLLNSSDTALVVSSAIDAANLSAALGEPVDRIVRFTDMFLDLVDTHRDTGRYFPVDLYDIQYRDIDYFRSKLIWGSALELYKASLQEGSHDAATKAIPRYLVAIDYLKPFIQTKIDRGEIYDDFDGAPRLLSDLGTMYVELASLYDTLKNSTASRQARFDAIEAYESVLYDFPEIIETNPGLTGTVGKAIIDQKIILEIPLDELVADAYELSERIAIEGCFCDSLNPAASHIFNSNNFTDPVVLTASNSLFRLSMELEREMRPARYRDSHNYKSSILRSASNAITMGDFEQARDLLIEIGTLNMVGDYELDLLASIKHHYAKHLENNANNNTILYNTQGNDNSIDSEETHTDTNTIESYPSTGGVSASTTKPKNREQNDSRDNTWIELSLPNYLLAGGAGILVLFGFGYGIFRRSRA